MCYQYVTLEDMSNIVLPAPWYHPRCCPTYPLRESGTDAASRYEGVLILSSLQLIIR